MSPQIAARALPLCAALAFLAAPAARADSLAGNHDLVVLAEPAVPAQLPSSRTMDLTLTWTVREIFAGEPGSVTIAVLHEKLEPAQFQTLTTSGRWILLADEDPKRPGRFKAKMPLRATPSAIDAFRKWSAPPDVRPQRALDSVVAEVREAAPTQPAPQPARDPEPAPEPVSVPEPVDEPAPPAEPVVAEGPVVETLVAEVVPEREPPVAAPSSEPVVPEQRVTIADSTELVPEPEPVVDRFERSEPVNLFEREPIRFEAPAPPEPVRVAEVDIPPARGETISPWSEQLRPAPRPAHDELPLTWQPALQPPGGPGLPPPPPSRHLGPPISQRDDLKRPKPPESDEDA